MFVALKLLAKRRSLTCLCLCSFYCVNMLTFKNYEHYCYEILILFKTKNINV